MEINRNEGRRELLARLGTSGSWPQQQTWYNTGWTASLANAMQYAQYLNIGFGVAQSGAVTQLLEPFHAFETTGGRLIVHAVRISQTASATIDSDDVISPATMVSLVRSVFSLNVSDAASAFCVSRPTIYQWGSLSSFEMIRSNKVRERIKSLYRLAKAWESFGPLQGRWQKAVLSDGSSLFELLCANEIDSKRIQKLHSTFVAQQSRLKQEEHQRAVRAVSKLGSSFAKLAANEKARGKGGI